MEEEQRNSVRNTFNKIKHSQFKKPSIAYMISFMVYRIDYSLPRGQLIGVS
jgi:hypothetical protein